MQTEKEYLNRVTCQILFSNNLSKILRQLLHKYFKFIEYCGDYLRNLLIDEHPH